MNKSIIMMCCAVAVSCGAGVPKAPTADQIVALVTTAVADSDELITTANEIVASAKALGETGETFAKSVDLAKKLAKGAVKVADVGAKACAILPNVEPYTKVCATVDAVHDKATKALEALSVLGSAGS